MAEKRERKQRRVTNVPEIVAINPSGREVMLDPDTAAAILKTKNHGFHFTKGIEHLFEKVPGLEEKIKKMKGTSSSLTAANLGKPQV